MPVHCWKNTAGDQLELTMLEGAQYLLVTVATITRLNMAILLNKDAIATNCSFKVFHADGDCRCGNLSATVRFSNVDCALISKNSSSTSSWSCCRPRRVASTLRDSASRLWCTSHRGLYGMKSMPTKSSRAGASCRQMGTSHAASDCVLPVPPM